MSEYKRADLRALDVADRTVTALFAVYGNVDLVGDRLHPGAFADSLRRQPATKIPHLWNHDDGELPIALVHAIRDIALGEFPADVRAANPDATGGVIAVSEYLDTPRGNEVLRAIRAGVPLQASFRYDVRHQGHSRGPTGAPVRDLFDLDLWEVSTVNFGANPATRAVYGVKAYAFPAAPRRAVPPHRPGYRRPSTAPSEAARLIATLEQYQRVHRARQVAARLLR